MIYTGAEISSSPGASSVLRELYPPPPNQQRVRAANNSCQHAKRLELDAAFYLTRKSLVQRFWHIKLSNRDARSHSALAPPAITAYMHRHAIDIPAAPIMVPPGCEDMSEKAINAYLVHVPTPRCIHAPRHTYIHICVCRCAYGHTSLRS